MMTKEQLLARDKGEVLVMDIEQYPDDIVLIGPNGVYDKIQQSKRLTNDELKPVVDPRARGKNRAYRRKLAAITRTQQKINRKR